MAASAEIILNRKSFGAASHRRPGDRYTLTVQNSAAAKSVESAESVDKPPTLANSGTVVSTTSQILNAAGQVLSSTGPDGQTTTFTFNALGQQTGSTLPNGGTTSTVYDALGRKISETDPNGLKTSYVYDAAGDLAQTIYADADSGSSSSDTENTESRMAMEVLY